MLSPWMLKAVALVVAGATMMMVALAIAKAVSVQPDSPQNGKFVGVRHDAATVSANKSTVAGVPTVASNQGQESATNTVVRNGITVVSPQLLVPVIDIDALQKGGGCDDDSSLDKDSKSQKRYHSVNRSHSRRYARSANRHWQAYGLAIR
ncbi:MAG: hypothetical protein ACJ8M1_14170 [Chthoniobacterales bacterium]